jgi:signal transduction histidine kinase
VPTLTAFADRVAVRLRALPPLAVDAVIVVVCLINAVIQLAAQHRSTLWLVEILGCPNIPPSECGVVAGQFTWWLLPAAVIGCVALMWRRRYPFEVTLVSGVCTTLLALSGAIGELPMAQLVATYTFASLCTPTQRVIAAGGTVIGILSSMGGKLVEITRIAPDLALVAICFTVAYALGVGARARRDRIAMLEERAARLAEEQAAAATRERERIAREMHDILAHSISMIAIQAEAGPVVVRSDPAKAEAVFDTISDTARDALAQLRRALGVLRAEPEGASLRPAPGLAALDALVEDVRHAGLEATLERVGEPRPITSDLEVTAYRIVQEALTNTIKHAAADSVQVRLTWADDALGVEVRDDGRGTSNGRADGLAKGGHGLIGMRERVAAAGGDLVAGPGPGGAGYRVSASLPLAAEAP